MEISEKFLGSGCLYLRYTCCTEFACEASHTLARLRVDAVNTRSTIHAVESNTIVNVWTRKTILKKTLKIHTGNYKYIHVFWGEKQNVKKGLFTCFTVRSSESRIAHTCVRGDTVHTRSNVAACYQRTIVDVWDNVKICSSATVGLRCFIKYYKIVALSVYSLLFSQRVPSNPNTHEHWKSFTRSWQVPPFAHVTIAQSSISATKI